MAGWGTAEPGREVDGEAGTECMWWWVLACGGCPEWRSDTESDTGGERAGWLPKVGAGLAGEWACDGGVCLPLGDSTDGCGGVDTGCAPGSSFGGTLEWDRRDWWWRFMIARCIVGGCARGWGTWVGPRVGLVVFAHSSAWTSMPGYSVSPESERCGREHQPFSSRMRSSSEFL